MIDGKLPEALLDDLEILAAALLAVKNLLASGRAHGLTVGLSPELTAKISKMYGPAAESALANTQRVASDAPFGVILRQP